MSGFHRAIMASLLFLRDLIATAFSQFVFVAKPTVDLSPFENIDRSHILHGKASVRGSLGNHGPVTGDAMARLAGLPGIFKKILVAIDPCLAVHVMHSVGTVEIKG